MMRRPVVVVNGAYATSVNGEARANSARTKQCEHVHGAPRAPRHTAAPHRILRLGADAKRLSELLTVDEWLEEKLESAEFGQSVSAELRTQRNKHSGANAFERRHASAAALCRLRAPWRHPAGSKLDGHRDRRAGLSIASEPEGSTTRQGSGRSVGA
jgi:hypothetical protein